MNTKKNSFILTALCIYTNYFLHGMQAIIIAQHSSVFAQRWGTDSSGILTVIAWTGIGKFISVWISGEISDRIGRKVLIFLGTLGYAVFFGGLMISDSVVMASVLAFIAGLATSLLDGASYPALQESFPKSSGSAVVAVKGFISVSQMLFPLIIGFMVVTQIWYGWAFIIPFVIAVLNLILLLRCQFAYDKELADRKSGQTVSDDAKKAAPAAAAVQYKSKPKFAIEGVCCLIFGFVSLFTFYLISQVLTMYGREYIGMSEMSSRFLMTLYTIGSLAAVLISTTIMAKGVKTIAVLLVFTAGSTLSLLLLSLSPTPTAAYIASAAIGFFAAGGALQAGIAVLGEFFPGSKGRNIGIYYTFMGLGSYVGPVVAGKLIAVNFRYVIYADTAIAILGFLLMVIVAWRYKVVFGGKIFSFKKVEFRGTVGGQLSRQ